MDPLNHSASSPRRPLYPPEEREREERVLGERPEVFADYPVTRGIVSENDATLRLRAAAEAPCKEGGHDRFGCSRWEARVP